MANTKINWTDKSWNPISGCSKISIGCKNCYAEVMAKRLQAMGTRGYENGFEVTLHPERLKEPYKWKKPYKIFVCSMSDLFHITIPSKFINNVIDVIAENPQHIFQILTKRITEFTKFLIINKPKIPENLWLGITVESAENIWRIPLLRKTPVMTKFISFEPLLSEIPDLYLGGIHWVIVGAESGHGARPMELKWARKIKAMCDKQGVAFWMKQICNNGRDIGFENYPKDLKVRNFLK